MDAWTREFRGALRQLRRRPLFTFMAVTTLALGVAAVTTVLSLVEAVLLEPLPVEDPEKLVWLWQSDPGAGVPMVEISYPMFRDLAERSESFRGMAATPSTTSTVSLEVVGRGEESGPASDVKAAFVTAGFFGVLGAKPVLGRGFTEEEDLPGGPGVVVVSHGFWRRALGGDPDVLQRELRIEGEVARIVGVAPRDFEIPLRVELWAPMAPAVAQYYDDRNIRFVHALGRLAPGVGRLAARAEILAHVEDLAVEYPDASQAPEVVLTPLVDLYLGNSRTVLLGLSAAVLLLLLAAGTNVVHLFLARVAGRRRELAVRRSLGAGRGAIGRLLAMETAVLALAAGGLALGLSAAAIRLLRELPSLGLPRLEDAGISLPVLLTALGLSLAVALSSALVAASGNKQALTRSLKGGSLESRRGRRLRRFLTVSEVALALALLVGAGLTLRTLGELQDVDPGFSAENVLTARVVLPQERYASPESRPEVFQRIEEELASLPGVEAAGAVLIRPLEGPNGWDVPFTVEGQSADEQETNTPANFQVVGSGYFRTLEIPLSQGRLFDSRDHGEGEPVAIVSDSVAKRYWPGRDAVGQRLKIGPPDGPSPWRRVVGVVANVRYRQWTTPTADLYVPLAQNPLAMHTHYSDFVVRSGLAAEALVPRLRQVLTAVDPELPLREVLPLEGLVSRQLAPSRLNASLLGTFAVLALVLSAVGIYGVLTFSLAQRQRELGIRMALGADRRGLLQLVLGEALRLALAGVAAGTVVAVLLGRGLRSLLYGVSPLDGPTFGAVAAGLVLVCLAAALLPARRASRVDPVVALRAAD